MAFANSSISDIIATTIQNRSGALADNVTANNALLYKLRERGNIKPFSGGNVILQEIMYNDTTTTNANSYSGYETINIQQNSPISAAQFAIKQYAAAVTVSGLEMLQNSGKEQIIDLLEGRIQVAEGQLENKINYDLFGDGTGNASKAIDGLEIAIAPATGTTYGGISRTTWSFWDNVRFDATTDGGAAVTAANIQDYMNRVAVQLVRGTDRPDLLVADNTYYRAYLDSMQAIQRVTDEKMAGAGFTSLKYFGAGGSADVVLGGGYGSTGISANRMYFINTKYLFFRPHKDRNFVPIGGDRMSVNQDAIIKMIGWAGNLTGSAGGLQGVLKD
ncbi:MAG TPA: phage major capsid protein [Gallionellaceae bacterium]